MRLDGPAHPGHRGQTRAQRPVAVRAVQHPRPVLKNVEALGARSHSDQRAGPDGFSALVSVHRSILSRGRPVRHVVERAARPGARLAWGEIPLPRVAGGRIDPQYFVAQDVGHLAREPDLGVSCLSQLVEQPPRERQALVSRAFEQQPPTLLGGALPGQSVTAGVSNEAFVSHLHGSVLLADQALDDGVAAIAHPVSATGDHDERGGQDVPENVHGSQHLIADDVAVVAVVCPRERVFRPLAIDTVAESDTHTSGSEHARWAARAVIRVFRAPGNGQRPGAVDWTRTAGEQGVDLEVASRPGDAASSAQLAQHRDDLLERGGLDGRVEPFGLKGEAFGIATVHARDDKTGVALVEHHFNVVEVISRAAFDADVLQELDDGGLAGGVESVFHGSVFHEVKFVEAVIAQGFERCIGFVQQRQFLGERGARKAARAVKGPRVGAKQATLFSFPFVKCHDEKGPGGPFRLVDVGRGFGIGRETLRTSEAAEHGVDVRFHEFEPVDQFGVGRQTCSAGARIRRCDGFGLNLVHEKSLSVNPRLSGNSYV